MRLRFSWLALLVLCCTSALGEATPQWLQVRTEHFTLLTDQGDRQARHVAAQLERMHDFFSRLLPRATGDTGSSIVVLAFKNRKEFQGVVPGAYLGKNSLELAGYFSQQQDRSYILLRLDSEGTHPYATVYHEYTHYINRHAEHLPLWLNEGMAEFFQNTEFQENAARIGQPDANEVLYLRRQRLIPLTTLFAVDYNSPFYHEQDKGNVFYGESWALTHMLYNEDFQEHRDRLREYLDDVSRGEDSVTAAQHAFGDLNVLQSALASYIEGSRFGQFLLPLQSPVKEADLEVTPVSIADVDAVRADVLMDNGRAAEARELIASVLKQAPGNAQAHESMGMLELRAGNLAEARRWYGEAVALHSASYLSYYYFGSLSEQLGHVHADDPSDAAIQAALRKAVELDPKFAPAAASLAFFDARQGDLEEAASMILNAVQLSPHDVSYRVEAAQIRIERKDFAGAQRILKAADQVATTPEEHERIQSRLQWLKRRDEVESARTRAENPGGSSGTGEVAGGTGPAGTPESSGAAGPNRAVLVPHEERNFPAGAATGRQHTVAGVLHAVACFYPKGLTFRVQGSGKPLSLYSNDMYGIRFSAANVKPEKDLNPCEELEGKSVQVTYAEVTDKAVAGQIVAIEVVN
jgi:Flp pilus assembly protein TadD